MTYLKSYKWFTQLLRNESFEPLLSWGFRMALSGTVPIIWGTATGTIDDAVWVALTAEAVSWVELKGSFAWRVRTLVMGALLAILFSLLGVLTGGSLWLSVIAMFAVGFLSTLLKNIGDRASGLAICVYLLFIICNAYPVTGAYEIEHRLLLIAIGAAWPVTVGIVVSLLMPAEQPFRRQIALIWRSIGPLTETISKSAANKTLRNTVYQKEKDVRTAIDNSYQFYGRMSHQVTENDKQQYHLVQLRKTASLVAINVIAMGEEMDHITMPELSEALRIKAASLFSALRDAIMHISIYVVSLKPEEKLLAQSHIARLKKLIALIRQYPLPDNEQSVKAINRILQLMKRTARLLDNALQRMEEVEHDRPVYRSYSFIKTLFLLKPSSLFSGLRVLFNFNTFIFRFALRSAVAVTVALLIDQGFQIDHGYWLPFSVMIIIQPYFGATFKKAVDRITGTLLGVITGGLLLHVPAELYLKELILFATFILMVYYVRKQYAVAAFFITLNLVLLFNIEAAYNDKLMVMRALCTVGGAFLAVAAGFALLPTWDKKWLPLHLTAAINCNYQYFISTFYSPNSNRNWTRSKRNAESNNSTVLDSFNRYMQEPGRKKTEAYYDLITYNVRITRNLNNIHLEQEEKKTDKSLPITPDQQIKINECLHYFNQVAVWLPVLNHKIQPEIREPDLQEITAFRLNDAQLIALEKIIIELKAMQQDIEKIRIWLP